MDFKLPLPIGELKILTIIEYIDGPKVFSCQNKFDQIFLVNWIDTSPESDKWFYVPVSDPRLDLVIQGHISLRDVILKAENNEFFEVITPAKGLGDVKVNKRNVESLLEEELPDEDSFVDSSSLFEGSTNDGDLSSDKGVEKAPKSIDGENKSIEEEKTVKQVLSNSKYKVNYENSLSHIYMEKIEEKRNSEYQDNLLPRKEDVKLTAKRIKRDVLDLSFNINGSHKHEIDAFALGYALIQTQEMVNFIPVKKKGSENYRLDKDESEMRRLKAVGFYAASFGVRLESEVEADLLSDTELSYTLKTLLELFKSTDDILKLKNIMSGFSIRATKAYYEFLNMLNNEKIELIAEWASPNSQYSMSHLSSKVISEAIEAMNRETKIEERIITVIGQLVGVNIKQNRFNLITDKNEHIHGKISEVLRKEKFTIPLKVKASIREATESNLMSGKESVSYILLEINNP